MSNPSLSFRMASRWCRLRRMAQFDCVERWIAQGGRGDGWFWLRLWYLHGLKSGGRVSFLSSTSISTSEEYSRHRKVHGDRLFKFCPRGWVGEVPRAFVEQSDKRDGTRSDSPPYSHSNASNIWSISHNFLWSFNMKTEDRVSLSMVYFGT